MREYHTHTKNSFLNINFLHQGQNKEAKEENISHTSY